MEREDKLRAENQRLLARVEQLEREVGELRNKIEGWKLVANEYRRLSLTGKSKLVA